MESEKVLRGDKLKRRHPRKTSRLFSSLGDLKRFSKWFRPRRGITEKTVRP